MTAQMSLFDDDTGITIEENVQGIKGLTYCPKLLSITEEQELLREVDAQAWRNDLKRRVQHYGYKYDYKARAIDRSMFVGPLPAFAVRVAHRLLEKRLIGELPDQVIVNEYEPGQGITAHIDCEPCFKDTIATVSLGSAYEMDFLLPATTARRTILLETGSALILRDEARYNWMHRIQSRLSDSGIRRRRRVSLTFRNVILV